MTVARQSEAVRLEVDSRGLAVLTIDTPGSKLNILTNDVFLQLQAALEELARRSDVVALVVRSGKPDNFIAGADIHTIAGITDPAQGEKLAAAAQSIFHRLADLPFPTVAAIHGPCLGGGLELALACSYRLVSDDDRTALGLPEVQLGVIPGAGGTQRLPRLVGLPQALDLILTGRRLRAGQARKVGLADEVVPVQILHRRAEEAALELAGGRGTAPTLASTRQKKLTARLLEQVAARSLLYAQVKADLRKKTAGHYPAPFKALEAAMAATRRPLEEGLALEARLFGEAAATPESKALIHLFQSTTALKADTGLPEDSTARPRTLEKIGVLGGGLMGSGIATVLADRGYKVRVKDRSHEILGRTLSYAYKVYQRQVERRRLRPFERDLRLARISPTTDYSGFKRAGMVIEAVFEDLDLKHRVLREVEEHCPPDTIFASNTSSIPIGKIASAARRPENVIGMHFFSPVEKMQLVEVIVHPGTSPEVVATTVDLGKRLGKHVITVNDGVGFYTSRVLAAYMHEAIRMLFEGAAIDDLDRAMVAFGFPIGPIALMDEVGIDVGAKVMHIMAEGFPGRFVAPEGWERIQADNRLGKKNRRGFYSYRGAVKEPDPTVYDLLPGGRKRVHMDPEDIQQRCVMAFLNECAMCLQERVLRHPTDGDVGAVFGLGFPPFLGGPFFYMDRLGARTVTERLELLAERHGPFFTPSPMLVEMARSGQCFFSRKEKASAVSPN